MFDPIYLIYDSIFCQIFDTINGIIKVLRFKNAIQRSTLSVAVALYQKHICDQFK